MGFRYVILGFNAPETDVLDVIAKQLNLDMQGRESNSTVELPDKIFDKQLWLINEHFWSFIIGSYLLIDSLEYDIGSIAEIVGGTSIGVGVEDVVGETWYQRFENGKRIATYHCGDGMVIEDTGEFARVSPQEWTENILFDFLPSFITLDEYGACKFTGDKYMYDYPKEPETKSEAWWKFW